MEGLRYGSFMDWIVSLEDLDFSLNVPNPGFQLQPYLKSIEVLLKIL